MHTYMCVYKHVCIHCDDNNINVQRFRVTSDTTWIFFDATSLISELKWKKCFVHVCENIIKGFPLRVI